MNSRIAIIAATMAFIGGALHAQVNGVQVKQGATINYRIETKRQSAHTIGSQTQNSETTETEQASLTASKVSAQKIEWAYVAKSVKSGGMQKKAANTSESQRFVTDAVGHVLDVATPAKAAAAEANTMSVKVGGVKSSLKRFFLPGLAAGVKPGGTWHEDIVDTTVDAQTGMVVVTTFAVDYRYVGTVDTLGGTLARVDWEAPAMTYSGGMKAGGGEMTIEGDGAGSGVSYISTKDGMIVAGSRDIEANMRLTTPQMALPIAVTQSQTITRVK
jgi:hypothetical protein